MVHLLNRLSDEQLPTANEHMLILVHHP
jgi:hypothetical protein